MPAPTIGHVILTGALIIAIFTVQVFYFHVVNNVWAEMVTKELKEIADYVADTIANLYFLVNATSTNPTLEKTLKLPLEIGGSSVTLEIMRDQNNFAQTVKAALVGKTWLYVNAWLPPGLKVNTGNPPPPKTETIQSSGKTTVAGCQRFLSNIYIWIVYKG